MNYFKVRLPYLLGPVNRGLDLPYTKGQYALGLGPLIQRDNLP